VTGRQLFDAGAIRALDRRTVFVRVVERPTLVLGSTQNPDIVDPAALARHGVELVGRRSGGGAVLLEPGRAVWLDTWVPRADRLWSDDVTRSSSWVGSWWAESLGDRRLDVHRGPPMASRWSDLICFAGVVSGEVVLADRKLVGIAQWRTRTGALTHSLAYVGTAWGRVAELLGIGTPDVATELAASTATLPDVAVTDPVRLVATLIEHLPDPESWERGT
jgi:lipoate-protein ligase A